MDAKRKRAERAALVHKALGIYRTIRAFPTNNHLPLTLEVVKAQVFLINKELLRS